MAKIYTIPNIITFIRIVLIPIILYLLFSENPNIVLLAGGLFILVPIVFYLNDIFINCFLISIYLIGFLSDRKMLVSPKKRFLIKKSPTFIKKSISGCIFVINNFILSMAGANAAAISSEYL